jgi:hypothetical protein
MTARTAFWIACTLFLSGCPKKPIASTPAASQPSAEQSTARPDSTSMTPGLSATPAPPQPTPVPAGPLGEVDRSFLDSYDARRKSVLATTSPYIVVSGSSLILHIGADRKSERVISDEYHALKDIAHIPFAIYLLLSPVDQKIITLDSQKEKLTILAGRIQAAKPEVNSKWFSPEQLAREQDILQASSALIADTLSAGTVSHDSLLGFARAMGPKMARNAWDAGCAQIRSTHQQMMKWKADLSEDGWNKLVVVNRARHQARYRNVATQYFHWLFGDTGPEWSYPGESMRVIYAESLGPQEDASDELATVIIDADASAAFFGNPWRLSEDILSEGATACIQQLPETDRHKP